MARKKDSPQKAALRELMGNYLKENNVKVKDGTDVNSIMRDMMSIILEGALDQELDEELGYSKYDYRNKETDNSRNGHSQKTLHTSYGDMEIDIPRDRKGDFEPQVVKKYQNSITQDMEEKIISMYAKGMTTADIESHMRELYDLEISDSTVSRITDKILPIVKEWQERPLESVYAVVFMDAIHFHARNEGRIVKRAVYIAIGIDMEGRKDVLGMYVGQNESAKFWLSILNGLKNRGVEDILIACVDGLTGFPQAIEAVFPQTEIQQCIIHQIRNTTKFVSYKEIKPLMADLKRVYAAPTEEVALAELDSFDEKWSGKYPKIAKSWKDNWANLSTYFKYPEAVRRLIYTTNTIEGFNRQLRKVNKSKTVQSLSRWYVERCGASPEGAADIPDAELRTELLGLFGIGGETADDLMLYVFSRRTFVADTYARRLFAFLGFDVPAGYLAFHKAYSPVVLDTSLSVKDLQEFHGLIDEFGKAYRDDAAKSESFLGGWRA
mgnify:CR=1 FL=1